MIVPRLKIAVGHLSALLVAFAAASPLAAVAPRLSLVTSPAGIRASWTNEAPGYLLEVTPGLTENPTWTTILAPAVNASEAASLTIEPSEIPHFYRLRLNEDTGLTTIANTSPADREPGVSVNREIVLNFSRPLAADTVVSTTNFFAGVSGRKFLARVELASDRRKASLFFLEPVRGSTRISAVFDGTGIRDATGRLIDADGDGREGGSRVFTYDTFSTASIPGTAVVGRVFASELVPGSDTGTNAVNRPLAGVTITVDGAEESLRAVTDANGFFKLTNAPAGRFFVHIDGRTSPLSHWPGGDYYPFVGKAWEAMAGRDDNQAGGTGLIYLPLISANTLQPTSLTQDTVIGFPADVLAKNPALAGVTLTIPAGSLFDDNGNRGGKVGIAPVPPDRLPGPLPPGLDLPLVITVQTDGAQNFDRPVPICFPNVPNADGFTPTPGMKAALVSFDHDTGEWRVAGSMTVSEDGRFICTDPGAGVLKPGWHGTGCPVPEPSPETPPGPPIGKPCNQNYNQDCKRSCESNRTIATRKCDEDYQEKIKSCDETANYSAICAQTRVDAAKAKEKCLQAADDDLPPCLKTCLPAGCSSTHNDNPAPLSQRAARHGLTPVERVSQLLAESSARVLAIDALGRLPTEAEFAEVSLLLEQVKAITGPDVGAFWRAARAQLEAETAEHDLYSWGAPAYPLFAKVVISGDRVEQDAAGQDQPPRHLEFNQRFMTAPFGQYVIYPPLALTDGVRVNGRVARVTSLTVSGDFYDARTRSMGRFEVHPASVFTLRLPSFTLVPLVAGDHPDQDGDGLPDVVENIVGTNPGNPDSDGDGLQDGAELDQGTNPLDGRPASVGIQATVKGAGAAYDVAAFNEVAITAEGTAGVSLFNVTRGYNPVFVGTVATPGDARAVALGNGFAAVGGGAGGISILQVGTDASATLRHTLPLGSPVGAVAAQGGLAFAGTDSGEVVMVEALSGLVLSHAQTGQRVNDLGFSDGHLFVLTDGNLAVFRVDGPELVHVTTVPHGNGFIIESITGRRRLAVGGGLAWVTGYPGFTTLSVTNPAVPVVLGAAQDYAPNSFKQLAPTGSGYGVATVGVVPTNLDPKTHNVQLFDLRDPAVSTNVVTQLDTPGLARAVALYAGLAYVADSEAGLQVMSYLPFDTGTNAPAIRLTAGTTATLLEAGQTLGLTATVSDDVQVREVEFYLNGQRELVDGGFPFEVGVQLPANDASRTNVTLRARAIDTGGNATWSEELRFGLVQDATPPVARPFRPAVNGVAGNVETVAVGFNEPVDLASLEGGRFTVGGVGPDGILGTADDAVVGATLSLRNDNGTAFLAFGGPLPAGRYQARLLAGVADVSGNATRRTLTWNFRALEGADLDQDGLTDPFETQFGFDPSSPDQNRNGVPDGFDDDDGDGVPNFAEMLLGLNPRDAFTYPPSRDDQLDRDGDRLTDAREVQLGTDWLREDTDGDLFTDDAELLVGKDPLSRQSYPLGVRLTQPTETIRRQLSGSGSPSAAVIAQPPVEAFAPGRSAGSVPQFHLGFPPVEVRGEPSP
jgi:hypothetical protein